MRKGKKNEARTVVYLDLSTVKEKLSWIRAHGLSGKLSELFIKKKFQSFGRQVQSIDLYDEAIREICLLNGFFKGSEYYL